MLFKGFIRKTSCLAAAALFTVFLASCSGESLSGNGETYAPTEKANPTESVSDPGKTDDPGKVSVTVVPTVTEKAEVTSPAAGEKETKDTTPPVITGTHDIEIFEGDTISYKKGIEVTDDVDGNVKLEIDHSAVKPDVPGTYEVIYSATDSAGNRTEVKVNVLVKSIANDIERLVNEKVDEVIAAVVKDDMTAREKAYAIFLWCRDNLSYKSDEKDFTYEEACYAALYDRSGDCYVSYALLDVLYKRLGFETMMLKRVGGTSNHYWNYVNYGECWYHCDCIKRHTGTKAYDDYWCFMQTDAQVDAYTALRGSSMPNCYTYDKSAVPECNTYAFYDGNTHEFIPDTEAPTISGVMDLYIAVGDSVAYKKNVRVKDNSGEDIKLKVDNSKVDLTTVGVYPIVYSAVDSAGNRTEKKANLHVEEKSTELVYDLVDNILNSILTDKMSAYDRALAIFHWIQWHITYVEIPTGTDKLEAAYDGLTQYKGDCYVFANVAELMLTRAGIDNIMITKDPAPDVDHYWSIINIGEGWYHFDSTVWWDGTELFYLTDSELEAFSKKNKNSHAYDKSLYPTVEP